MGEAIVSAANLLSLTRFVLGAFWLAGQIYIMRYPLLPMIQIPLHLMLAMALVVLYWPCEDRFVGKLAARLIDTILFLGILASTWYFLSEVDRLTSRMESVAEVFPLDVGFGIVVIVTLLECVRRTVGWALNAVILVFLFYAFFGYLFPGWLRFGGFGLEEMIETLTMTGNGVLGVTTSTSVQFVYYFVAFGAFYSVIGGSQLFIDVGVSLVGHHKGGAPKTSIISSALMGTVSGSAVANVVATGVFTIPFMRRCGMPAERAAATEAISSTGGQLMPPVMGIAAFVMAEFLQVQYVQIALAGIIPALAYYVALFVATDLHARRTGEGTITNPKDAEHEPLLPRLYLLAPPCVLILFLVLGYSATYSALVATFACVATAFLRRRSWLSWRKLASAIEDTSRQAATVAVPIAAIGIIIAVAIQSNLALKFSTRLIEISGGTLYGAMIFVIIGCIIMGMGLPTVAAYIIGAILFVPALMKLGIHELGAHYFVMYYSVLSMVTPPVALASYAAAGLAKSNSWATGMIAFRMCLVSFFIPFAFAFDPALLGQGPIVWVVFAFLSLTAATGAWAVALTGWFRYPLNWIERGYVAVAAMVVILSPTGGTHWYYGTSALLAFFIWAFVLRDRFVAARR